MAAREFTTRRTAIVTALAGKFKNITLANGYRSDVGETSFPYLKFWDEINEYPSVYLNAGSETRVYQGGGYKDRYLSISVKAYVQNEDDPVKALELLLEDLETVIEENGRLAYLDADGATQYTRDIIVLSIDTDEGLLAPLGVGEIILQVSY
jgi:hypothetical protein